VSDVEHCGEAPDPRDLRCSDTDREHVAEALRSATADGRIDLDELHERLERTYTAKTYRELEPLIADLPGAAGPPLPARHPPSAVQPTGAPQPRDRLGGTATSESAVAVMSGTARSGAWVVPASFTAVAVMGEVKLDLREARFEAGDVTVNAVAIMGGVTIVAPPDLALQVDGVGFMGAFEGPREVIETGRQIRVRITGLALMGAVEVKRRGHTVGRQLER
jgi:hypothetical protein